MAWSFKKKNRYDEDPRELYRKVVEMDDRGVPYDRIAEATGLLRFQVIDIVQCEFGRRKVQATAQRYNLDI